MSLIKNIEIDTLKLRALQVRDSQNNPISSGFQLFALGDGTTYWSAGITTQQFVNLSTSLEQNQSTLDNVASTITSTLDSAVSTLTIEVFSSIYSISSFLGMVQDYSINTVYTDAAIGQLSSNIYSTISSQYQSVSSASTFYGLGIKNTANSISTVNSQLSTIISSISTLNKKVDANSTITTSTIFGPLSTYTNSTFAGIFTIETTNFNYLNALIAANVAYTQNSISTINGQQAQAQSTFNGIPGVLTSTIVALSTLTQQVASTNYQSSINYTNQTESTLWISTLTLTSSVYASTNTNLVSTVSSLNILRGLAVSSILSTVYQLSTINGSTLAYFNENISVLLSTGLTQNIYQTFIDLQAYSANIIYSTTSTSYYIINSTTTSLEQQSVSSFNGLMDSSFAYINNNLYYSSISTLIPLLESTINNDIISSNNYFNSVINTNIANFEIYVGNVSVSYTEDVSTIAGTSENEISTTAAECISTQNGLLSTNVEYFSTTIGNVVTATVTDLSSFTYSQFLTAPSIIMNRVNNISTLTNTQAVTGLSTLKTGIVTLDASRYNNFYVLINDMDPNIYYGLALTSTSKQKLNQDFTVQIDIQSTYANKFYILDTSNLSGWLNTPNIYNPKSYNIITNDLISLPPPATQQQVYLSTFVGAYIIDMKYTSMGMFIKNVQSYPYIYTNVVFTGTLTFPKNVQISNSGLALNSTFVYRGSPLTISWQTNDLNIPLGVKFTGTDIYNNKVSSWSGPFSSATGTATIKIPTPGAPLCKYDTMYLGVYPNNPRQDNTTAANAANPIFNSIPIPGNLYVVNPTINSYIRVLNPGTVNSYLQVSEIKINNDLKQNMTQVSTNSVFTIDTDSVNVNTYPYNGSFVSFGSQNAFDNNLSTYFFGGYTATQINPNAYVGAQFSTLASFQNINQPAALVSSIDVYSGPLYNLQGMQLIFSNRNEPGLVNGLFYSTINLNASNLQSYSFS